MAKPLQKPLFDWVSIHSGLVRNLKENPELAVATDKGSLSYHAENISEFWKNVADPVSDVIHKKEVNKDFLIQEFELVYQWHEYPDWNFVCGLEKPEREKLKHDMLYKDHVLKLEGEDDFTRRIVFGGNCLTMCQIGLVQAAYIPGMNQTEIWADFFFRSTNVSDTLMVDIETCCSLLNTYYFDILKSKEAKDYPINMVINLSRAHVFRKQPAMWRRNA